MFERKLTDEQAREIREKRARDQTPYNKLAKEYGITDATIRCICTGQTYKNVGGPIEKYSPMKRSPKRVLTNKQARKIRERHVYGDVPQLVLSKEYKVTSATIRNICIGRTYKDAGGPISEDPVLKRSDDCRSLTAEEVKILRERVAAGETCPKLAKEVGLTREAMYSIARGYMYQDAGGPLLGPGTLGSWSKTGKIRMDTFLVASGFTQDLVGWALQLPDGWLRVEAERGKYRLTRGKTSGEIIDAQVFARPKKLFLWILQNLRDLLATEPVEIDIPEEDEEDLPGTGPSSGNGGTEWDPNVSETTGAWRLG